MNKKKLQSLFMFLLVLVGGKTQAQVLVNREWEVLAGLPDTINWTATTVDLAGNLLVAGNTQVGLGQTAMLVTKYDTEGNTVWQQTYQHNGNAKNYATAVIADANGDVFVTGATGTIPASFDVLTLKLDVGGTVLWGVDYNGASNLSDIPTAIALDNQGNVYVTGGSVGFMSQSDYVTLMYDAGGTLKFASIYDYANLHDAAVGIGVLPNGNVVVTGASASSINNYDYATIEYDANGTQLNVNRQSVAGAGLDNPVAMEKDGAGNIYITGKVQSGGNTDIRTIKLNANFALQWAQGYDNAGLEDVAEGLAVDATGHVYVTGYTTNAAGNRDLLVLKYGPGGNLLWQRTYSAEGNNNAGAKDIAIDSQGNVYVGGYEERNSGKDFLAIRYSSMGNLQWIKNYGGSGMDEVLDMETDSSGNVFVTGRYDENGTDRYATLKYSSWKRHGSMVTDSLGYPSHVQNEIVVRFSPEMVNVDFVDNMDLQYARLDEIIPDSVIVSMNEKVGHSYDFHSVRAEKIHKRMTTADSVSVSRLGEIVRMPKYWSSLLLVLPEATPPPGINLEQSVCDSLGTLFPVILYAHPDFLGSLDNIPNDTEFPNQISLSSGASQFPNSDINVNPAWDIETGNPNIKVGIYDTGIDWRHPDFRISGGNTTTQISDSKIVGGWDFFNNQAAGLLSTPDHEGHGTACAGIIGALRNNLEGIAGIAGGDMSGGNGNTGCQLFMMKIFEDATENPLPVSTSKVSAALIEGSAFNPNTGFGYGIHVINNSWGMSVSTSSLADAIRTCFENKTITVCSRGNFPPGSGISDLHYPACYRDEYVLNVGGTGTDGSWKTEGNGDPADPAGDDNLKAMVGNNVDVAAPATNVLVRTCNLSTAADLYTPFNGTSAAAPHVAGVAALMLAQQNVGGQYHPNNLAPEDVEFLIQRYAQDVLVPSNPIVGYDNETGFGRLDAGNIMQHLDYPLYRVIHSGAPASTSMSVSYNQQILLAEPLNGLAAGWYWGDKYQITYNYIDVLPASATILDAWPRYSSTIGVGAMNPVKSNAFATFSLTINPNAPNVAVVTMLTSCYYITSNMMGQQINGWFPSHYNNLSTAYSLHVVDPQFVSNEPSLAQVPNFSVYPNPATDKLTFTYTQTENAEAGIEILDIAGRTILQNALPPNLLGSNTGNLQIDGLAAGVYLCRLKIGEKLFQQKFVKL